MNEDFDTYTIMRALFLLGCGLVVIPGMFWHYRGQLSTAATHAMIWIGLTLALMVGYAYRDVFQDMAARVSSELVPAGRPMVTEGPAGERSVRLRRSSNGPFVARAVVNGSEFTMMVDTGASSVVLKATDAVRAGIDMSSLNYSIVVETANGQTFCAPVRLREISVGGIKFSGVEALVAKPGNLKESLLGMSFLKRLRSYEVSGDFLTLRS